MSENFCVHSQRINNFIDANFNGINEPFTAGFELTAKCNLNCLHCYAQCDRRHKDFSLEEFKYVFDTLIDRGLFSAYFTGGEIFTRSDFADIYTYAKKKGVLIVLLSNITLLNQRLIDLFNEYPVENISTTMYGYSEETYERVTGVKGSFKQFMNGLELLQKNDIPYELKFVALKQNFEDIYKVREFGKKLGVDMIISAGIHPMNDGTLDPLDCRLSPEQAFEFDINDPDRSAFWKNVAKQLLTGEINLISDRTKARFAEGYLYPCMIADQHVFITSDLKMQGCVRASFRKFDLRTGSFDEGWNYLQQELVNKKCSPDFKCRACKNIRFCEQCTANFGQIFGDEEKVDSFYCKLAELRRDFIDNTILSLLDNRKG